MRWRANTDGDTRIAKGFLFCERTMYPPKYNWEGTCLSDKMETRWLEWTTWKQKFLGVVGDNGKWVDISWAKK